jgi:CheY-like chemotaxis protein
VADKSVEPVVEPAARVLVADDDEIFLEILANTIQSAGAEVVLAHDGLDALEQLSAAEFDILVTDLNMPRMDGLTLLRHVRDLYPNVISILITGFGSLESAIEAFRLGIYDYIQKPFMTEQVSVTIRNAIERVKVLKEKEGLLEKIEILHKKLCLLERKRYPGCEIYDSSGQLIKGPLFSDSTLRQDAFLENPEGNPTRALAALEALKNLRRECVITETELKRIKQVILKRTESGGS